jgi:3-demethoxyubiquinol 3-hydroxylase
MTSLLDRILIEADNALRCLFTTPHSFRSYPAKDKPETEMTSAQKRDVAALMRVNHTGEVCAQALYRGQMFMATQPKTFSMLEKACIEEQEHLSWTATRIHELSGRVSWLNSFWYTASWGIGVFAAAVSDSVSLGFVEETERQVEQHLNQHLHKIPDADDRSRAILQQMKEDEIRHGQSAHQAGATTLPQWCQQLMRFQSKVMTSVTYWI